MIVYFLVLCFRCVALRVLQLVNAANLLMLPILSGHDEKTRQIPGSARPSSKVGVASEYSRQFALLAKLLCSRQCASLCVFHHLNLWKMRLPLHTRESSIHSIRSPESIRRGLCFSQVMPFPM